MADRVILTIRTKKGVFVTDAARPRRSFALHGPLGPGVPVCSTLSDTRGTPRLYASSCNPFFDMKGLRSTDMGESFKETKSARLRIAPFRFNAWSIDEAMKLRLKLSEKS